VSAGDRGDHPHARAQYEACPACMAPARSAAKRFLGLIPGGPQQAGRIGTHTHAHGCAAPISPNRTGSVSPALQGSTGGLGRDPEVGEKDSGCGPFTTARVGSAIGDDPPLHMHSLKYVLLIGSCIVTCLVECTLPWHMPRGIPLILLLLHIPLNTRDVIEQILALLCCRGRRRVRGAKSLSNLSLPRMTSPSSLSRAAISPTALTTKDVVEQIFGFISPSEIESLCACALVCSSWRLPSQRRLFNGVQLWHDPARKWERLLFCLEMSPHLRSYIRDLMVLAPVDLPANLGQLFHRVSTLDVHVSHEMHLTLILALPALKHLTCICHSTGLPYVFSKSDTICVYDAVLPPAAPKLRHLMVSSINEMFQEHMLSWIESTGIASDLESACLKWHYQEDRYLAAFLRGCRPAFRRLVLDLNWVTEKGAPQHCLAFSYLC
jgi:hypothetical protein